MAGDFLTERPPNTHILVEFQGSPVIIAKCTGLATPGFTMISDENAIR